MNEDIKGILIQDGVPTPNNPVRIRKLLVNKEAEEYITNLQKENEELKNQLDFINEQNKYIDKLEKMIKNYKQRNEKAIEWCECVVNSKYTAGELPNGTHTDMGYCLDLAEPLLNILKGAD